ncbi:hypothetical protein ABID47_003591 [Paenibacillus favisporus]|uniref:Uncharacterized protein n=1 Tax=Paenibacillus favisporus TaxID=221028 RepID=A0ABV2F5E2_9BACL
MVSILLMRQSLHHRHLTTKVIKYKSRQTNLSIPHNIIGENPKVQMESMRVENNKKAFKAGSLVGLCFLYTENVRKDYHLFTISRYDQTSTDC